MQVKDSEGYYDCPLRLRCVDGYLHKYTAVTGRVSAPHIDQVEFEANLSRRQQKGR